MLFQVMFEPCCNRTAVHELRNLLGSGLQLHVLQHSSVFTLVLQRVTVPMCGRLVVPGA
jgi:hypothetical protein